jgi:tetratricopeptide (TPR) repeat protein
MRFPLPVFHVLLGLAAILFAAPTLLLAWQSAGSGTPAPRVLRPQGAQPISPAAAQRGEPATVVIDDGSPSQPGSSGKAATRLAPSPTAPAAGREASAAVPGSEPVIEAARLKGIQPGTSTMSQVRASWGEPQKTDRYERHVEHSHRLDPFQQVIVAYQQDKVTAIVVHLQMPLKAEVVTAQLGLEDLDPGLVYDAAGAILGQVFPERGVLFSFQPGAAERLVAQIVLEPIYPQPFALRAESRLATHWTAGLNDVEQALKLQPQMARAHWLKAQLLAAGGRPQDGLRSAEEAVRLDAANVEYRLTRARLYHALGETVRATNETKTALEKPSASPLVKARGLCLLAELTSTGPQRDYRAAVQHRQEAMSLVEPLLAEGVHAAAARDIMLEIHFGTAHDIAWGPWHRKPDVVPKWLEEAKAISQEDNPPASTACNRKMKLARAALGALAGMQGEVDPAPWIEMLESSTVEILSMTDDPLRRAQLQWDMALSYYDAMQIHHARGESQSALKASGKAIDNLTQCAPTRGQAAEHKDLLGRVYFRTGAVHAVLKGSHSQALAWYDRALPLLKEIIPSGASELGKRGESLVSMAVSYWEVGQRKMAVELTSQGLQWMQQAVSQGAMQESALSVPYSNLAQMHRRLGDNEAAGKFAQMAARSQGALK